MRLATFNLLHGRSLTDGRVDADRVSAAVAALDADILGLQEVDHGQPRSGHLDLTALAADALGAHSHRFAPAVLGTPGETWRPWTAADEARADPTYGIALVSRWPVLRWQATPLPAAPVRSPIWAPGPGGGLILLRDEPRVLLAAVIDAPTGPLTVACTHLSFVPGWNVRQLRTAVRALAQLPAPRILLGDLNLPAALARAVSRWRILARRPTYPAVQPRTQLDHILADPRGAHRLGHVTAVDTPASTISDHRPLLVQLEPRPQ
ncbi:endonuclease/exonuclease/phosphatase family protein [Spirilliplanes yamanashiensis]|uniref:Endonuclease/exonuclease/phosphatase n=1 Tax=Spirilliplanes yamanashiensis TaxID=42233 RepID=A0A8J3YB37_9ACTN|nr:endonuclease/exonuclease/phosphatase family protein [Spirilliplanes yamanashiensis]MDP9817906.1 endonuclease/exonuclease/phosphatase family metal-dependent hydrolase [Spirilliplanes yamanashiensis]GIJ04715.1 endonuclease/exonuclease/phosphatase [Spirilliplanes yamanashiensis]